MHSATLTLNQSSKFETNLRRQSVGILYAIAIISLVGLFAAAPARAQEHWPPGAIARFTGDDISFEGSALGPPIPGGTSFFISSGSVLTVHSGDARLNLPGGGTVDICGPAKLTLLESNTVYTIALNFGRVHVRLADPTQLHVFTPFVMATPISIAEEARDLTIGLDINDAMCVFAAQGAARLEDQFSSEGLMVPQLGEFFLSGEKLSPTGGPAGTCRCIRAEADAQPQMSQAPPLQPKSTQPEIARSTAPPAPIQMAPAAPRPSTAAPSSSPAYATNQAPPPTVATPIIPSKPQRPAATNQPPPSAPSVAATQPASIAPTTTPASPFPTASNSKPKHPPTSTAATAQQPPPAISTGAPRTTSVIPTVEAAAPPPPPPAEPTEANNPPPKSTAPPAGRTISGSAPEADNGFTMPDHANEKKPVAVHIFGSTPVAPQLEPPVRVVMPPLTFSASMPTPPVDTNPQLITLVHEARVTKDWVFKGHVAETKPLVPAQVEAPKPNQPRHKRRGILTVFKQFFGGNPPPPKP
jgi:hypothetical protein